MDVAEHIAAIDRDGTLLAAAADRAGPDAVVPSCSPWRVRDLLKHQGYVHRWASRYVTGQLTEMVPELSEAEMLASGPADAELTSWFRDGHQALVSALRSADPELRCWTFLPAPSPLAFWARRQAHETAVHRVDAELALGPVTTIDAAFAADGIDELIMGFFGRDGSQLTAAQRAGGRQSVQVMAADTDGAWQLELTEDGTLATTVRRGTYASDCELAGPAAELYLLLWNRADLAGADVTVSGDREVLLALREGMKVTWE